MAGLLTDLRALMPLRPLSYPEALSLAERQAAKLLKTVGVEQPPIEDEVLHNLPRIRVERISPLPAGISGACKWTGSHWLILLNAAHNQGRQRFSLAHELKHVLDHPFDETIYPDSRYLSRHDFREQIAHFFAACLLMPRPWVKRAWAIEGVQHLPALAERFGVSLQAMQYRLEQTGLVDPPPRCAAALVAP